jgi:hypothetical protein
VPGFLNDVRGAYLLADAKQTPLAVRRTGGALIVAVPAAVPDADDSVVVLDIAGAKVLSGGAASAKPAVPTSAPRHP